MNRLLTQNSEHSLRFFQYGPGEAASGGHLCTDDERPYLHMLLYSPRLKRQAKQELVQRFTEVFVAVLKRPVWQPVIHLCEHPYDNVGIEGKLLSESYSELSQQPYYYDLPRD